MGALRDFELAGWQSAASTYDGFAGATRLFVPALVQAAGAEPGMRLLDIACGTGWRRKPPPMPERVSPASISRPPCW